MQRLLEQGGLSFMDEMLLVNVLRLPPLALDDMRTALSPVYPDRRGQGAQGDNVWVSVKPAGTPSAEAAAALLKQLSVAQPSNPFGATGVARSRWPRLTNCRLFPAWGYLDKEALQSPSAQLVRAATVQACCKWRGCLFLWARCTSVDLCWGAR